MLNNYLSVRNICFTIKTLTQRPKLLNFFFHSLLSSNSHEAHYHRHSSLINQQQSLGLISSSDTQTQCYSVPCTDYCLKFLFAWGLSGEFIELWNECARESLITTLEEKEPGFILVFYFIFGNGADWVMIALDFSYVPLINILTVVKSRRWHRGSTTSVFNAHTKYFTPTLK